MSQPRTLEEINAEFWRIVALIEAGDPRYARPAEQTNAQRDTKTA